MRERIIIFKPFAYIDLLGYEENYETVETKKGVYDAKRIIWRLYWVGLS